MSCKACKEKDLGLMQPQRSGVNKGMGWPGVASSLGNERHQASQEAQI